MAAMLAPCEHWYARVWRSILRTWMSCQIEFHGQYSVQRMLAFDAYRHTVNLKRVMQLLLLTFVPGLVMEMTLEAIPLGPLKPGRDTTGPLNFWIRTTLGTYIVTHSLVGQYCHNISGLHVSSKQLIGLSTTTTVIVTPIFYWASQCIGFPVPFFVVSAMVPWTPIVLCVSAGFLRNHLRREDRILSLFIKYTRVFIAQTCLIIVSPAFSYLFNANPSLQTPLAVCLPVMKVCFRNWFGFASRHIEDLKPELVVFNVEIFSALYVATCMQNTTSIYATVVIITVDIVQAWLSIKDLNETLNDHGLKHSLMRAYNGTREPTATTNELIPLTMFILQANPFVRNHASIQLRSCAPRAEAAVAHATQIVPCTHPDISLIPAASSTRKPTLGESKHAIVSPSNPVRQQSTGASRLGSAFMLFAQQRVQSNHAALAEVVGRLSNEEQLLVVQKTLHLLHICEFVALIEYTEVFVPVVYSIFSTVAYTFPNRGAFVTLRKLSPAQFMLSLKSELIYGSLEMVSYLTLEFILRRKLGVSAFAQTAFVLETQWPMVQSKLTLWMLVALQFAHSFYGNDFTFRFEWLKHDAPP